MLPALDGPYEAALKGTALHDRSKPLEILRTNPQLSIHVLHVQST